jgi:cyclohexanecarboxylate-CoA ligase
VDPDRVSLVLFTSGTTGQPKAALHTLNTFSAVVKPYAASMTTRQPDRFFTPHAVTHRGGIIACVLLPLFTGGCSVIADAWEPGPVSVFLEEAGVTHVAAAPVFLNGLIA